MSEPAVPVNQMTPEMIKKKKDEDNQQIKSNSSNQVSRTDLFQNFKDFIKIGLFPFVFLIKVARGVLNLSNENNKNRKNPDPKSNFELTIKKEPEISSDDKSWINSVGGKVNSKGEKGISNSGLNP